MARTKSLQKTTVPEPKTEEVSGENSTSSKSSSTKKAPKSRSVKEPEVKVVKEPEVKAVKEPEVKEVVSDTDVKTTKGSRNPRKKVTQDAFQEKLKESIKLLDDEIESRKKDKAKGVRVLRKVRKNLKSLEKDAPKLSNKRGGGGGNKVSGFVLNCEISKELRDFISLQENENPTRTDITNAVCAYIKLKDGENRPQILKWKHLNPDGKRDLQNKDDKMAIIPDEKLSKLLGYEQYKKDVASGKVTKEQKKKGTGEKEVVVVNDDSLRYWVVQRLLQSHIKKGN